MRQFSVYMAICTLTLCVDSTKLKTNSIKAVAILTRHGDRAPVSSYPRDPYKNYKWHGGFGALSVKGIQQLYESGRIKSSRYAPLLAQNEGLYSTEFMYCRSSAIERCLVSGESFLAGLMPPPENRNILPIRWQPIPIHSIPREEDDSLAMSKFCPRYDPQLVELLRLDSPEVEKVTKGSKSIFFYIGKKTGMPIVNLGTIAIIIDALRVHIDNGLAVPKWAKGIYEPILKPLERVFHSQLANSQSFQVKGGILLHEIMGNFENFLNKSSTQNIFFYSGHDITLQSLAAALGILGQVPLAPAYGASIVMELHTNRSLLTDLEIRIFYFRNGSDVDPLQIEVNECGRSCSFKTFQKLMENRRTSDFVGKCSVPMIVPGVEIF